MTSYSTPSVSSGPVTKATVPASQVQEFSIRVPKNSKKRYHVMRFNSNLGVDFGEWKTQNTQVKMERENNFKEFRGGIEEESPKFGAGSEFGREAKDEARKRKFGMVARKYKPEDQPWILKIGGKNGKKFKGIREGGVSDNTAYYVFTQAGKGIIDAYPLNEWYKFQPIQRYKALTAEEAEEEFGRRNKIINYFSVMVKKRLRNDEDGDLDGDDVKEKKSGGKKKDRDLKISEMDDWVDSDDDVSGSENEDSKDKKNDDDDDDERKKKKNGKKGKKGKIVKKKKKKNSDDEAFEESDDGDEEGRELDYISSSSESGSDHEMKVNKELKGVAEEDALRKLLNSESEDEDEEEKKEDKESNSEEENKKDGDKEKEENGKKKEKKMKKDKKVSIKKDEDSSSELSPNSSASDSDEGADPVKISKNDKAKFKMETSGKGRSRSSTPVPGEKRKLTNAESAVAAAKKAKLESPTTSTSFLPIGGDNGVTEDAVRRYLMRKPMTTTELLQKFKSKKTGLSSEQLVNVMTQILKNINPVKQMIKNKMYLSIKPTPNNTT